MPIVSNAFCTPLNCVASSTPFKVMHPVCDRILKSSALLSYTHEDPAPTGTKKTNVSATAEVKVKEKADESYITVRGAYRSLS